VTDYLTYGTSTHTPAELAEVVGGLLGQASSFVERDSDYWGEYLATDRAAAPHARIQPNALPDDDLYLSEHPDVPLLLVMTMAAADAELLARLAAVEGLVLLTVEKVD
jgi:hypothetical protein